MANCAVEVAGNYVADDLDVDIKLWRGSICVRTWNVGGNGYVFWYGTTTVS